MAKSKRAKVRSSATSLAARPPSESAAPAARRRRFAAASLCACLGICLAAFLTYRSSLSGRMFFDDASAIEHNGHVFALVDPSTRWTWESWRHAASSAHDTPLAGRPVASLSFALNHWWASAMKPSGMEGFTGVLPVHYPYFHYVNLALHMMIALLIFALARLTLLAPSFAGRFDRSATTWAFALALVWVVHPLNTEPVVYLTQRTEQLVSLFLLLTLLLGTKALDVSGTGSRIAWQTAAVVCCALGMGSKENMIAAPLLAVAYDRAFRFESWRATLRARWGYYAALAATWLILFDIMRTAPRSSSVGFGYEQMPWYEYLITQCWCLWRYTWLTIVPLGHKLCVDYGRRAVLDLPHVAPGAILVLCALAATVWGWLRKPWVGFLGTWFFFILAPTSSFVPIVTEIGAERRMYLPVLAVICAAFALVIAVGRRLGVMVPSGESSRSRFASLASAFIFAAGVAWLGYTSHARTKVYDDLSTLYGHIVDVFPDNDRGLSNFAKVLIENGYFDRALDLVNRAVAIDPQYTDALSNRGYIYLHTSLNRRLDLALAQFDEALNWSPIDTFARNNRGYTYGEAKLFDEAYRDYTQIIALTGGYTNAYIDRATLALMSGETDPQKLEAAVADTEAALKFNAYSHRAYVTQAQLLTKLNRPEDALKALTAALDNFRREALRVALEPGLAPALAASEQVFELVDADRRRLPPSVQADLERFPYRDQLAQILNNRAAVYRLKSELRKSPRDLKAALDDLSRAAVLQPRDPRHYSNRGDIYLSINRIGEALLDYNQALTVAPQYVPALRGRAKIGLKTGDYAGAWLDAKQLRDMGTPLDDETLASLRKLSGLDYP